MCHIFLSLFLIPGFISFIVHLGCLFCGFAIIFFTSFVICFGFLTSGSVPRHAQSNAILLVSLVHN
jgi:hypothetical protein